MVTSLRHAILKKFGNIDYIHYFRRMIRDYESGQWDFDIRSIVKNIKVEIPCPKYVCRRGFSKRLCLTIIDEKSFIKEFSRYYYGYILPIQVIRKNRILARRLHVKKYGYITKYNQDCSKAGYVCKNCDSRYECDLSRKLSKKDDHIYKITRMLEILYKNLHRGHWSDLVET